jgi:hypothetical protein
VGPDGLTALHLKHLGPKGISYLTSLYNLSMAGADLPAVWKTANIVPILKPGKNPNLSTSYRPISLLSPLVKVLERLLLPLMNDAVTLSDSQHGFLAGRLTTTALLPLSTAIALGFNQNKPPAQTAVVAIDISKAFDWVDHTLLIQKLADSTMHSNIVRWLSAYIRGRQAVCLFTFVRSKACNIKSGVPKGGILSPTLFNFFISHFPDHASIRPAYADDFYNAESSPDIPTLEGKLTNNLKHVSEWADAKNLKLAPDKCLLTLFTPWTHQTNVHPQISLNGSIIPLDKTPKYLGTDMDVLFTSARNAVSAKGKASKGYQVMKALTGTSWGENKETNSHIQSSGLPFSQVQCAYLVSKC